MSVKLPLLKAASPRSQLALSHEFLLHRTLLPCISLPGCGALQATTCRLGLGCTTQASLPQSAGAWNSIQAWLHWAGAWSSIQAWLHCARPCPLSSFLSSASPPLRCVFSCKQVLFSTNIKEWNELIYHYTVDRPDEPSRNPVLGQPTLLVWGQDDPMAPLRFGEQLQR